MQAPNFAKDKVFAEQMMSKMISIWQNTKANREERERRWMDAFLAWSSNPAEIQEGRNDKGRANIRIRQLRKEIETMTRRSVKGLFQEDYLKAIPNGLENEASPSERHDRSRLLRQ